MGKRKLKSHNSQDWIVVRFIDDCVIQLCPEKTLKKKVIIGHNYYVKWKDGYKYLAVVLKRGTKHEMEGYINSEKSKFPSKNNDNLFDKEHPLASKENTIISPEESKSVVADDMHLLSYVENEAVQPCFKNLIDSNVTESLLNL